MHPIERLRWLARAHGESAATLATEVAWTLADLAVDEPHALVTACRRLLDSHVAVAQLWWVSATVLVAADPAEAARQVVEELCDDPTALVLAAALGVAVPGGGIIAVTTPADTVRDAVARRPDVAVRVLGSLPQLHGEVRSFGTVSDQATGWELDEACRAVDGASLAIVEVIAAGPDGMLVSPDALPLIESARAASVPCWAVAGVGTMLNSQLMRELGRRAADRVRLVAPGSFELMVGPEGGAAPNEATARVACPQAPELLARAG